MPPGAFLPGAGRSPGIESSGETIPSASSLGRLALGDSQTMIGRGRSLLTIAYLVIGAIIAGSHNYFEHVSTLESLVSAVLALILWPLILLHINLHAQL